MTDNKNQGQHPLLALTGAAVSLPGIAIADTAPSDIQISFSQSQYTESSLDSTKVLTGDSERYDISVQQFRAVIPFGQTMAVSFNAQNETLSGASPWYVDKSNASKPVVMSSASIEEKRRDFSLQGRRYYDSGNTGVTLANSSENDYDSVSIAVDTARNFNDKHTTVNLGFSLSDDSIEPTQGNYPTNTLKADKESTSVFIGASQIINKTTVIQFGVSSTNVEGFLSDAYKFRDRRPDTRQRTTVNLGMRKYLTALKSSFHCDYRFYTDDWDIQSHTLQTSLWYPLTQTMKLVPSLRWYSQNKAPFFANSADSTGKYHSSDYRLSAYGAVTLGVKLTAKFDQFALNLIADRYLSDESHGIFDETSSPALVDFTRLSLGLDYTFD